MAYNSLIQTFGNQVQYNDLNLNMLPNPGTGDLQTVSNLNSILQSMQTLIFINEREISFLPSLGGDMQQILFEDLDRVSALQLKMEISGTLTAFEKRINVVEIDVVQDSTKNGLFVTIYFSLVNSPNVISLRVFLNRTR